ncbi:MAG TPA: DUF4340 domain-containing protein [Candidatus Polarisedimenticolaceae bacterium]|nr:DUF4340 domain-containing protein [Candidatus Polarisedimenticolaceae bacterium]
MSLRGLAVLLLVLAVLAIALVRLRGPKEDEKAATEDAPLVAAFDEAKVRAIRTTCGETSFSLQKGLASGWRLVAPYAAEADPRETHTILAALSGARVRKVIAEATADPASFGLGPDACTVRLELEGDAAGRTVALGRSSPVGYERYAKDAKGRIVFADGSLYTAIAKAPDALEERRLLPLDPESVVRLSIERPDGTVVLARVGEGWRMEAPVRDTADAFEADRAVRAATSLEMERGTKATPPTVTPRERRIALRANGMTALVAAAGVEGKRLAWREGTGSAGLVPASGIADFDRPAAAFRDRLVLGFSSPDVRRVAITRGGTSLTIARASEAAPWTARQGSEPEAPADGARVTALIERLRSVRATSVEDGAPPSPPTGTLEVSGEKAQLGRASWGPLPPAGGEESLWVTTPARAGTYFRVPASAFGPIPQGLRDLAPSSSPSTSP